MSMKELLKRKESKWRIETTASAYQPKRLSDWLPGSSNLAIERVLLTVVTNKQRGVAGDGQTPQAYNRPA